MGLPEDAPKRRRFRVEAAADDGPVVDGDWPAGELVGGDDAAVVGGVANFTPTTMTDGGRGGVLGEKGSSRESSASRTGEKSIRSSMTETVMDSPPGCDRESTGGATGEGERAPPSSVSGSTIISSDGDAGDSGGGGGRTWLSSRNWGNGGRGGKGWSPASGRGDGGPASAHSALFSEEKIKGRTKR